MLPDGERVEVTEVKNQSWPFYCWYQGNFLSRVDINIEQNHYWTHLLNVVCHEVYPGHHTERLVREQRLYLGKDYFETSILLIYSPEMVISEGIGMLAEKTLFDQTERSKILLQCFSLNPKKEDSPEDIMNQNEIREGFEKFKFNLAYHKYVDNWDNDKLLKYCESFEVLPYRVLKLCWILYQMSFGHLIYWFTKENG